MKETCDLLGLSRWTVMRLIGRDELTAVKGPFPNSPLRIEKASVDGYISRRRVRTAG